MGRISDEQFITAIEMIKQREALMASVSDISAEIKRLTQLRSEKFACASKLKNNAIARAIGVNRFTIDNISQNKYKRARALDREFFDRR